MTEIDADGRVRFRDTARRTSLEGIFEWSAPADTDRSYPSRLGIETTTTSGARGGAVLDLDPESSPFQTRLPHDGKLRFTGEEATLSARSGPSQATLQVGGEFPVEHELAASTQHRKKLPLDSPGILQATLVSDGASRRIDLYVADATGFVPDLVPSDEVLIERTGTEIRFLARPPSSGRLLILIERSGGGETRVVDVDGATIVRIESAGARYLTLAMHPGESPWIVRAALPPDPALEPPAYGRVWKEGEWSAPPDGLQAAGHAGSGSGSGR